MPYVSAFNHFHIVKWDVPLREITDTTVIASFLFEERIDCFSSHRELIFVFKSSSYTREANNIVKFPPTIHPS